LTLVAHRPELVGPGQVRQRLVDRPDDRVVALALGEDAGIFFEADVAERFWSLSKGVFAFLIDFDLPGSMKKPLPCPRP
jgi:hypothetical protein